MHRSTGSSRVCFARLATILNVEGEPVQWNINHFSSARWGAILNMAGDSLEWNTSVCNDNSKPKSFKKDVLRSFIRGSELAKNKKSFFQLFSIKGKCRQARRGKFIEIEAMTLTSSEGLCARKLECSSCRVVHSQQNGMARNTSSNRGGGTLGMRHRIAPSSASSCAFRLRRTGSVRKAAITARSSLEIGRHRRPSSM